MELHFERLGENNVFNDFWGSEYFGHYWDKTSCQKLEDKVIKDCVAMHMWKETKLRLARNSEIWHLQLAVCFFNGVCVQVVENMEQQFLGL